MATVRYTVLNGALIAEKRAGVQSLYVPDPQGNTRALLDNAQSQSDTYNYWPYGETRTSTGSIPTPFRYGGGYGYYTDSGARKQGGAREIDGRLGSWLSVDPLWPNQPAYIFAADNPCSYVDYSGLQGSIGPGDGSGLGSCSPNVSNSCPYAIVPVAFRSACEALCACFKKPKCRGDLIRCFTVNLGLSTAAARNT